MIVDDITETAGEMADTAKEYAQLNIERAKLDIAEGLSVVTVKAISTIVKVFLLFNVVFFLSMGLALVIGELIGIQSIGYFIIGAIFLALLIVYSFLRKSFIEKPVVKMYLDLFFKK